MEVLLEEHGMLRIAHEEELTMTGREAVEEGICKNHRIFAVPGCGETDDGIALRIELGSGLTRSAVADLKSGGDSRIEGAEGVELVARIGHDGFDFTFAHGHDCGAEARIVRTRGGRCESRDGDQNEEEDEP